MGSIGCNILAAVNELEYCIPKNVTLFLEKLIEVGKVDHTRHIFVNFSVGLRAYICRVKSTSDRTGQCSGWLLVSPAADQCFTSNGSAAKYLNGFQNILRSFIVSLHSSMA